MDGTNVTLNSGRILINLKPLAERRLSADDVIRRLQPRLAAVQGITLFMQPVQDLSVEDRVSRTQFQYSLEDADGRELATWAPRLVDALRAVPALRDVSTDQQDQGLGTALSIDRATASRLGVSPQTIDNTLYDAFGQRQVSTMFTQLNQYRVVLEVQPGFRRNATALRDIYVRGASGGQPVTVPLSAMTQVEETTAPLAIARQGQFPAVTLSFNLAPGAALGAAVRAIETTTRELGLPASIQGSFQGTAQAFRASLSSEPLLILAALAAVYIVLGVLYESYIHPLTILSTLPSAGVGAILALLLFRHRAERHCADRHHSADRHREEERDHDDRLRAGRRAARGQVASRRDLPGLPAALPAHHDDHAGRAAGRAAAGAGPRRGLRAAAPARPGHRGRADREPGADALHHARDLPGVRPPGARGVAMSIAEPFIRRPIATTLLTIALALSGVLAFSRLPVAPLPQVDFPTIQVSAALPGASPETMATSVAAPLERQFGHIAAVTEMTSTSNLGSTGIVLQFDLNRDINGAARDVQAAINAARGYLPPTLPNNPTYRKVNPADAPILILALTSTTLDRGRMYDAASSILQQKLSQVPGVGQVIVGGGALARGPRRGESAGAEPVRDRPRGRPRRAGRDQRQPTEGTADR